MTRLFFTRALAALLFLGTHAIHASAKNEAPYFFEYDALPMYTGKLHAPVLSKDMCSNHEDWKCLFTLEDVPKKRVNFNGAFTVATWGCGTSCQIGLAIDRTDGRSYTLPQSEGGYEYYSHSSLLVVNPDLTAFVDEYGEVLDWAWRKFYHFYNGRFELVWQDKGKPRPLLDTPHPINPDILKDLFEGEGGEPPLTAEEYKEWCEDHPEKQCQQ